MSAAAATITTTTTIDKSSIHDDDGWDIAAIIPSGKIKAQLQSHKDVGKIPKQTEEFIACCAALFLKKLMTSEEPVTTGESTNSTENPTITLEQIKRAASRYEFINLDDLHDQNAPRLRKKRRTINTKTAAVAVLAVETAIAAQVLLNSVDEAMNIFQDDDEYD